MMDENNKLFKAKDDTIVAQISPTGEGGYKVLRRERIESGLGNRHCLVEECDNFTLACGQAEDLVKQYEADQGLT